jgi:hypothetical protein
MFHFMTTKFETVALAAAAMGLVSGCSSSGQASMTVLLSDAPGDFQAAVVTITEIDLDGPAGTTVLSTTKTTTDLLKLAGNTATLVNGTAIEPGSYDQLRFVITGGYVQVDNGAGGSEIFATSATYEGLPAGAVVAGTLKMPSFAQSGLKVDLPSGGLVVGTEAKVVMVDFKVAESFGHEAGNSGSWVMHPVVQASDVTLSGTLNVKLALGTGVTLPLIDTHQVTLADFSVTVMCTDGVVRTEPLVLANGTFGASFQFLAPATETITFTGPVGLTFTTSPASPATATVSSGQLTEADFTVTAATSP